MTSSKEDESSDKTTSSWGTWEELLLACAVKRHGLKNWDSVAMELQTKTSLPHLLTTAQFCKQKYMDLKRRFKDNHNNIPWLEHLRKVRVDELKQDLQRYDLSINCLQLKVKRLEEERDRCLDNNNTTNEPEPDLSQPDTSLNDDDKRPQKLEEPDKTCARLVSGDESDRENRSVNESNSTGLSDKVGGEGGRKLIKSEADPCRSGLGGDGVGQGQGQGQGQGETTKEEESEELGDSVTQLSSDVQSSASYGRKKRKIGSGGDAKSEPLIELLDVIRTHKHASLFERRLKLQESSKYKEIVRQHVDLETIQTRVEQGTYSSRSLTNFYRDLLLVFNNAIVFFAKSSLESTTAHQLRRLVSIEINKETPTQKPVSSQEPPVSLPPQPKTTKPPHLERSDSLLDKQKSSAPIIVCRKRSSVSAKQSDDKKPATTDHIKPSVERSSSLLKLKAPENSTITGTRSSRRNSSNNKNPTNITPPPPSSSSKKQSTGTASGSKAGSASVDKQEHSKTDNNKKTEASSASDKKKSVVDFLKRIKKNSPVQTAKKNNNKGVSEVPKRNSNNYNNNSSGKKDKKGKERQSSAERRQRKDTSPPKKNVGRPPKKAAETTPVTGKRAREEVVTKRQSKRSRR